MLLLCDSIDVVAYLTGDARFGVQAWPCHGVILSC